MPTPASLGVDIGGTKTLCLLLDEKAKVLAEIKFKTQANKSCDRFLAELTTALRGLRKKARTRKMEVVGVGIGFAGQVNREKVEIVTAPNILCLEGCPIGKVIDQNLRLRTVIGNDVQVGLWGEHQAGIAKGASHV